MIKLLDKSIMFILSFLIFSNAINYMNTANIVKLTNVHLFAVTLLFTAYMFMKKPDFSFLHMKLMQWVAFYLFIVLLWYIFPNNELTEEELRRKILSILSLVVFTVFIFNDDENLKTVRFAILFATAVSVINNIYEFFHPAAFFSFESGIGVFGRSAGFYINPSVAGKVILLGLIFSIGVLKKSYRSWFLLFAFLGILATFSRSAILGFILFYIYLSYKREIDMKYSILIPVVLGTLFVFSLPFLLNHIQSTFTSSATKNITNRIEWFMDPSAHEDLSQKEREHVALTALKIFSEHPLVGSGLGHTRPGRWPLRVSAHNIYLTSMAELGIIGIFIFPLLIYSLVVQARGEAKMQAAAFALLILYMGFFAHTLLDELDILFIYALMANISYRSYMKSLAQTKEYNE